MYWLIGIFYLIIVSIIADAMVKVAEMKGYDAAEVHAFAYPFWLGIFGVLYVVGLPDRTVQQQNEIIIKLLSDYNKENDKEDLSDELPEL